MIAPVTFIQTTHNIKNQHDFNYLAPTHLENQSFEKLRDLQVIVPTNTKDFELLLSLTVKIANRKHYLHIYTSNPTITNESYSQ